MVAVAGDQALLFEALSGGLVDQRGGRCLAQMRDACERKTLCA